MLCWDSHSTQVLNDEVTIGTLDDWEEKLRGQPFWGSQMRRVEEFICKITALACLVIACFCIDCIAMFAISVL